MAKTKKARVRASGGEPSQALARAAERAIWAYDVERALRNAAEGRVSDWDEAVARLRAEID